MNRFGTGSLVIDSWELRVMADRLDNLALSFDTLQDNTNTAANNIPRSDHHNLRGAVNDFSNSWRRRRTDLSRRMREIASDARGQANGYETLDGNLRNDAQRIFLV